MKTVSMLLVGMMLVTALEAKYCNKLAYDEINDVNLEEQLCANNKYLGFVEGELRIFDDVAKRFYPNALPREHISDLITNTSGYVGEEQSYFFNNRNSYSAKLGYIEAIDDILNKANGTISIEKMSQYIDKDIASTFSWGILWNIAGAYVYGQEKYDVDRHAEILTASLAQEYGSISAAQKYDSMLSRFLPCFGFAEQAPTLLRYIRLIAEEKDKTKQSNMIRIVLDPEYRQSLLQNKNHNKMYSMMRQILILKSSSSWKDK